MAQRYSTVLKALTGLAFGLALTATAAQSQIIPAENRICLWNKAAFNVKMQVTWNNGANSWTSKSISHGFADCMDFGSQGVPEGGDRVQPDAKAEVKVYAIVQPNGQTLDCAGTTGQKYYNFVGKAHYNTGINVWGNLLSKDKQNCNFTQP